MNPLRLLTLLSCILIGLASRLAPHPPNVTAMNALVLFGTYSLGSRWLSLAAIYSTLFLSDLLLGFHATVPFVYLSFGLAVALCGGLSLRPSSGVGMMALWIISSIFFLTTNFGVWLVGGLYPKSWEGLSACYLAALPFFVNMVLGDWAYALLLRALFTFTCRIAVEQERPDGATGDERIA